jgi:hypothetical protein
LEILSRSAMKKAMSSPIALPSATDSRTTLPRRFTDHLACPELLPAQQHFPALFMGTAATGEDAVLVLRFIDTF